MFYDKYIDLCKKYDVKPTPVAVSLGLSSSNVAQWKKGSTPRPAVLQKIADYFGVKVSYFFEDGEEQQKSPPHDGELKEIVDKLVKLDEKSLEKISKFIDVMLED